MSLVTHFHLAQVNVGRLRRTIDFPPVTAMLNLSATALALVTLTVMTQAPAKVTGTLAVDSTKVVLSHAHAVAYENPSQGRLVSVLLSDRPVNANTFAEYTRIGSGERYVPAIVTGAWTALHLEKAFSGFSFTVDANRRLFLNDVLIGGQGGRFTLVEDLLVLELASLTPRVTGRIRTKEPVVDVGRKVSLDVSFDAALTTIGK